MLGFIAHAGWKEEAVVLFLMEREAEHHLSISK